MQRIYLQTEHVHKPSCFSDFQNEAFYNGVGAAEGNEKRFFNRTELSTTP